MLSYAMLIYCLFVLVTVVTASETNLKLHRYVVLNTPCSVSGYQPASIHSPDDNFHASLAVALDSIPTAQLGGYDTNGSVSWIDSTPYDYSPPGFDMNKLTGYIFIDRNGIWTVSPNAGIYNLCSTGAPPNPDFVTFFVTDNCAQYGGDEASIHSGYQNNKATASIVFANEPVAQLGGYVSLNSTIQWFDKSPMNYYPIGFLSTIKQGFIILLNNGSWTVSLTPMNLFVCSVSLTPTLVPYTPHTKPVPGINYNTAIIVLSICLAVVVIGVVIFLIIMQNKTRGTGSGAIDSAEYGMLARE